MNSIRIKVRKGFRITIPKSFRDELGIRPGDFAEVNARAGKIMITPSDYVETFASTPTWLKAIGAEAKRKGLNKVPMKQIDTDIAAGRRERGRDPLTARRT